MSSQSLEGEVASTSAFEQPPERWQRLERLFKRALDLPPERRTDYLTAAFDVDADAREEVTSLLAAHAAASREEGFLQALDVERAIALIDATEEESLLERGEGVGRYRLIRRLARGGMGLVYLAHDPTLDRRVALKFLPAGLAVNELFRRRFMNEARAASALDHPNVATVYEIDETRDGQLYIAMAYYEGETLRERIARGPLPWGDAVDLATQMARGLAAAHSRGIVHCDIKPGNVILTADGVAKIVDFGIARMTGNGPGGAASAMGTVAYMSPEQTRGVEVDHRTDLWALGVVLYEMLTGVRPFDGDDRQRVLEAIRNSEHAPIDNTRPDIPDAIDEIISRCLRKKAGERYSSAGALHADLRESTKDRGPSRGGAGSGRHVRARRLVGAGIGSVILALIGLLVPGSLPSGGSQALESRDRIILADFSDRAGDPTLAKTVTEALRIDLAQSENLAIVEPVLLRQALERMARDPATAIDGELAREIAVRDGLKGVVTGEVGRVGGQYLITGRLESAETGAVIAGVRQIAGDSSQIITAVNRLSSDLREGIGESIERVRESPPLPSVTTPSLPALRKYAEAREALRDGDESRARAFLLDAVALDTAFAMAYLDLSTPYGGLEGRSQRLAALQQAYQHRDRLTDRERFRVTARYHFDVTEKREHAIAALRALLTRYPDDWAAVHRLSLVYYLNGSYQRAAEMFRRTIQLDRNEPRGYRNLLFVLVRRGAIGEAWATLERMARIAPKHPLYLDARFGLASSQGDYDAAIAALDTLRQAHGEVMDYRVQSMRYLAVIRALQGRLARADSLWVAVLAEDEGAGMPASYLWHATEAAWLDAWHRGEEERALRRLQRALARYPLETIPAADRPYPSLAMIYAIAGHEETVDSILREYKAATSPDPTAERWSHLPLALSAQANGDLEDALAEARQFRQSGCYGCDLMGHALVARVYEVAGEPDSAIVNYRRFLETPRLERQKIDALWRPIAYESLGRLLSAKGEHEAAARYHREFVRIWKDADPELQPRVAAARTALAAHSEGLTGRAVNWDNGHSGSLSTRSPS